MNDAPRRLVDRFMTILIVVIGFMVLGQVLAQVLLQYMIHLILAGAVIALVWIVLRQVLMRGRW